MIFNMAISKKHRYQSRRERLKKINRNIRMVLLFTLIALALLAIRNRVYLWDYLKTYFM